jgi:hypothetical protein
MQVNPLWTISVVAERIAILMVRPSVSSPLLHPFRSLCVVVALFSPALLFTCFPRSWRHLSLWGLALKCSRASRVQQAQDFGWVIDYAESEFVPAAAADTAASGVAAASGAGAASTVVAGSAAASVAASASESKGSASQAAAAATAISSASAAAGAASALATTASAASASASASGLLLGGPRADLSW